MSPVGDGRLDALFGCLIAAVVNLVRGKGARPVEPQDTVPDWGGARAEAEARARRARAGELAELWRAFAGGGEEGL